MQEMKKKGSRQERVSGRRGAGHSEGVEDEKIREI